MLDKINRHCKHLHSIQIWSQSIKSSFGCHGYWTTPSILNLFDPTVDVTKHSCSCYWKNYPGVCLPLNLV